MSAIVETYESDYFTEETSTHRDFGSAWAAAYDTARFSRELREIVGAPFGSRRLLDIGSATGGYLAAAQHVGWHAEGVEISAAAREIARRLGMSSSGSLAEAAHQAPYAVITMHHVLEHVEDPRSLLRQVRAMLQSDGKLVIEVPNFRSTERRAMRTSWSDLRNDQHRWHFEPTSLRAVVRDAGFDVHVMTTEGEPIPTIPSLLRSLRVPYNGRTVSIAAAATANGSDAVVRPRRLVVHASAIVNGALNHWCLGKRLIIVAVPTA